jgi:hypothetical protein
MREEEHWIKSIWTSELVEKAGLPIGFLPSRFQIKISVCGVTRYISFGLYGRHILGTLSHGDISSGSGDLTMIGIVSFVFMMG